MTLVNSQEELDKILLKDGTKLIYVYSPTCPACEEALDAISKCSITMDLLLDYVVKIDILNCKLFCKKLNIENTPNILLFNNEKEISRLNFAPTQDDLLIWLTTMLN